MLVAWIVRTLVWRGRISLSATPGRPNSLTPVHVLIVFIATQLAGSLAAQGLSRWLGPESAPAMILAGLFHALITAAAVLVVAKFTFRHGLVRGMGLSMRHWLYDTGRGVIGYLAVTPICLASLKLINYFVSQPLPTHSLLEAMAELGWTWRLLSIPLAVVVVPLAEELFFRGLLQSMFRRYLRSPWLAILATSLLFALVHQPYWHTMGAIFALSVCLGYNYERTGRLYPAMLIHAIFNAVFTALYLAEQG